MFMTILFITAQTWKQSRCPTDEQTFVYSGNEMSSRNEDMDQQDNNSHEAIAHW